MARDYQMKGRRCHVCDGVGRRGGGSGVLCHSQDVKDWSGIFQGLVGVVAIIFQGLVGVMAVPLFSQKKVGLVVHQVLVGSSSYWGAVSCDSVSCDFYCIFTPLIT